MARDESPSCLDGKKSVTSILFHQKLRHEEINSSASNDVPLGARCRDGQHQTSVLHLGMLDLEPMAKKHVLGRGEAFSRAR
jgi:hypothetical protein